MPSTFPSAPKETLADGTTAQKSLRGPDKGHLPFFSYNKEKKEKKKFILYNIRYFLGTESAFFFSKNNLKIFLYYKDVLSCRQSTICLQPVGKVGGTFLCFRNAVRCRRNGFLPLFASFCTKISN